MAQTTLHPVGDGYYEEWDTGYPNNIDHWQNVDDDPHDSGTSTVNHYNGTGAGNITPFLYLNSTGNAGTNQALTDDWVVYTEEISRPGGGSWNKSDLGSLEMGISTVVGLGGVDDSFTTDSVEIADIPDSDTIEKVEVQFVGKKIGTKTQTSYCTAVRLLVTHAPSVHPKPTSLECERESSPTNASADPLFTAVWNATGGSGTATHAYIQVSEVNDFASTKWDSGWIDIADIMHGNRCEEISYNGTLLSSHPPNDKYYWRIKFKDASAVESDWSDDGATDPSELKGINRDNALPGYAVRRKLYVNTDHSAAIPAGWNLEFSLKTGERTVAATNGCFNEAVQASGGFQIEGYGSKLFYVYMSEQDPIHASGNYAIYIMESSDGGETWSTPVEIATAGTYFDTHFFPTLVIDKLGYLHVAYGAHGGSFKYAHSTNSADISAWSTPTTITGFSGTYPVGILVPTKGGTHGRIYWFWRNSTTYKNSFMYSDDGGSTWSSVHDFIVDTNASHLRVYCYGYRYDLDAKRLHIAYNHNHTSDVEKGVWYISSDLDETDGQSGDYGFNIWRWADDVIAGYSSGASGSTVDYNTSKAIVIADDHLARTFIECLELDTSGSPIVFWEQKTIPKAATNETYLVCATWSGSAWVTHYISDQVNRMLRVRRSSIGLGRDKDNVIRAIMPVRARTWWHFNPTADLDSVAITRKSEASNYLEVDEGPTDCDKDGSYFDVGSGGKASFSSTTDMIDGTREIFTLEIRAIVKHLGVSSSCYLYVDNGTTEYNSASIGVTLSTYEEKSATWDTNPFTSAAWTKSDLDSLQFGIKQAGANSFRVTRVFARAHYTLESDEEWGASEIFELTSSDNGATWQMSRELSRNSGIGIPIMNSAHHLHNNRIHVIWTSGFDLFYLTDKRFGLVRFTGNDLRVYYAGVEIDRVLDYANKNETVIHIKCQAEIPANRRAGADDYYVYSGNPNEATAAKSDPHGVYHRDFNNWEQHAQYADLNGQDGWTVSGGTAQAYSSPPDVSNKVGAGEISAKCAPSAGDFAMVKTIGSGLTNVQLDIFLWMEVTGGDDHAWAEFEDSGGGIFGAGLSRADNRAAYKVNSSWTNSNLYANYKSLNHLRLRVTSAGCSAWWNGNLIVSETSAITSVDKLRLCCNALTFFDFSRVGYSWATSGVSDPEVIVQDEEWRGFRIDATLLGRGSDSYIIDATIGGYYLHHESGLPAASRSGLGVDEAVSLEHGGKIPVSASLPIGMLSKLVATGIISLETSKGFRGDSILLVGFGLKLERNAMMPTEAGNGFVTTHHVEIEALAAIQANRRLRIEYLTSPSVSSRLPAESLMSIIVDNVLPVGTGGGLTMSSSAVIEHLGGLAAPQKMPLGWLMALGIVDGTTPIDFGYGLQADWPLPIGNLANLSADQAIPVEFVGVIEVVVASRLPIELGGGFTVKHTLPIDYLQALCRQSQIPLEYGTDVAALCAMPVESTSGLDMSGHLTVETGAGMVCVAHVPLEVLEYKSITGRLPVAIRHALAVNSSLPTDYIGALIVAALMPVGYLGTVQPQIASIPIGIGGGFLVSPSLPVAWLSNPEFRHSLSVESRYSFIGNSRIPLETLELRSIAGQAPLESLATVAIEHQVPVEWRGIIEIAIGRTLPVEFRGSVTIDTSIPVEHLEGVEPTTPTIPIAFQGSLSIPRKALIDWVGTSEYLGRLAIEGGSRFTSNLKTLIEILERKYMSGQVPVGFRQAMAIIRQLPVEWQAGVALEVSSKVPVEWTMALAADGRMSIERLSRSIIQSAQPVEYGLGAVLEAGIPVENSAILADIISRVSMSWVGQLSLDNKSPVELGQGMQTKVKLAIDNLLTLGATAKLPTEWTGGAVLAFPKALPICWRSSLVIDRLLPMAGLHSVQIIGGRLLLEWGLQTEAVSRSLIEYGQAIDIASKILADWLGAIDAHGKLIIENKASVSDVVARLEIEYGRGVVTTSEVPLSYLFGLAAESKIPVEWIGIFFTVMCIVNARLQLPGLINLTFTQPGTKDIALRITEIINASLKGGSDGCQ